MQKRICENILAFCVGGVIFCGIAMLFTASIDLFSGYNDGLMDIIVAIASAAVLFAATGHALRQMQWLITCCVMAGCLLVSLFYEAKAFTIALAVIMLVVLIISPKWKLLRQEPGFPNFVYPPEQQPDMSQTRTEKTES